jgi:glycosyltransferase involved in cell wall biosynthesis
MPAFNADRFIEAAIRSLLRERETVPLDVIVIDDGSTDGTRAIVETIARDSPEVRLLQSPRKGIAAARNTGLDHLPPDCRFVTFLDADDVSYPGRIHRQRSWLMADPTIDVLYGLVEMFAVFDDATLAPAPGIATKIVRGPYLQASMYRRAAIEAVGRFDESFRQGDDSDFVLRVIDWSVRPSSRLERDAECRGGSARVHAGQPQVGRAQQDPRPRSPAADLQAALPPSRRDREGFRPVTFEYSVVIPAYNAAATIEQAVASILGQSVLPREIIVVDDGSTDETATRAAGLGGRVTLVRQDNRGPGAATTAGFRRVATPFVATLDADDLWVPEKIARQAARLEGDPGVAGVFALARLFRDGETPDPAGKGVVRRQWTRTTMLYRTRAAREVGDFVDFPGRLGEVVDWLARSRELGQRHEMMEEVLALRRIRPGSLSHGLDRDRSRGYLVAVHAALERRMRRATETQTEPTSG